MIRDILTPTHLILILAIVVVLFGAKRLPDLSRSVARSMRIFKSEVREMKEEDRLASPSSPGTPTNPLEGRVVDGGAHSATASSGASSARTAADETTAEQRRGA